MENGVKTAGLFLFRGKDKTCICSELAVEIWEYVQ